MAIDRGRSSRSRRLISLCDTTAWTIAESVKPSISGHRISHPIANAMLRARTIASISPIRSSRNSFVPCVYELARLRNFARIPSSFRWNPQHLLTINPLMSFGSAKITSARSPIIPAATKAGAFFSGPSLLVSVFKRRLRFQNLRVCPSAVVTA